MSLILCIETATPVCSVVLGYRRSVLLMKEAGSHNAHSEKLTVIIDELLKESGKDFHELEAVAVSKGPGSYTGLRIGVSAAKGLCYALDIPLIAVDTLQAMALGMAEQEHSPDSLYCPMIDARRMEVYTCIYDSSNNPVRDIRAEIISNNSFFEFLEKRPVYFFGDGALKCKQVITHPNARFFEGFQASSAHIIPLAWKKFQEKQFENTAYFEPFYLKDFIPGIPKVKGLK